MGQPSKATLMEKLATAGMDTSDMDPADYTVDKLRDMLSFMELGEDDDDTDDVPAMNVGLGDDEPEDAAAPGAEPEVQQAPPEPDLDLNDLADDDVDPDVADRIAGLFGEAWEGETDHEDLGEGDVPEPYVELVANYHVDTISAVNERTGEPLGLDFIVKGQMRECVERAVRQGRKVTAYPVVAHNWPQTGNRRQIVVQVQVRPVRTVNRQRRTARGDRL